MALTVFLEEQVNYCLSHQCHLHYYSTFSYTMGNMNVKLAFSASNIAHGIILQWHKMPINQNVLKFIPVFTCFDAFFQEILTIFVFLCKLGMYMNPAFYCHNLGAGWWAENGITS